MNDLDLKKFRSELGFTQQEMADRLKIKIRTYQNYETNSHNIPEYMQSLIKYEFDAGKSIIKEPEHQYSNAEDIKGSRVMEIPLVNQYAYAGYLSGYADDEYMSELPRAPFIVDSKFYKGTYMAFEVKGDSMDNGGIESYPERSIVLGREVQRHHWQNKLHINRWDFIIVHKNEGILIKRIIDHDISNGNITLHSINESYEDLEINLNDVIKIFNVVKKVVDPVR